jgi:hypothetical protein
MLDTVRPQHARTPDRRLVATESANYRIIERGGTFADALRMVPQAHSVQVAVPHGFGDSWSYFAITKAEAQRALSGYGTRPDRPLHSTLIEIVGTPTLYIGNVYALSARDEAIQDAATAEITR